MKNLLNPRGVLHSVGRTAEIEDTGPLTKKRMETIDDETTGAAIDFMDRQVEANKPFFVWMNTTRMHVFTHVRPSMRGQSGMPGNEYADGMIEHDGDVGKLLKTLDDLKIADNTIVIYTTDNGPNMFTWPDAANSPFRSEKDSNWEGAFRVPAMVRWPGHIKPGANLERDVLRSRLVPDIARRGGRHDGEGPTAERRRHRRHGLQGPSRRLQPARPTSTGKSRTARAQEFYYFDDDGDLVAMRFDNWKVVFCEQRAPGRLDSLGRSLHLPPAAEDFQSADGPLRARRYRLGPVRRLACRQCLSDGHCRSEGDTIPADLRRLPAEPTSGKFFSRSGPARRRWQDGRWRRRLAQNKRNRFATGDVGPTLNIGASMANDISSSVHL